GNRSAVRQKIFYDVITIALKHDCGAAQVADLLIGPLDHPVALASLGIEHFACRGDLKPLSGAGFGFQLGHLILKPPAGAKCPWEASPRGSATAPAMRGSFCPAENQLIRNAIKKIKPRSSSPPGWQNTYRS